MALKVLADGDVGLPEFAVEALSEGQPFSLGSHTRAREALAFGLSTPGTDYNVYVIGPERSGRMSATREFVETWVSDQPPTEDWVYVGDFDQSTRPRPLNLPAGRGGELSRAVEELLPALARALASAFSSEGFQRQLTALQAHGESRVKERLNELDAEARRQGLSLVNTPQGAIIAAIGPEDRPVPLDLLPAPQRSALEGRSRDIMQRLAEINRDAARMQREYFETVKRLNSELASRATEGLLGGLREAFSDLPNVSEWLELLAADVVSHYELFLANEVGVISASTERAVRRYAVNLFVDCSGSSHPSVVVEQNPTYENLFGRIEYRQLPGGGLDTDVSLLRPGALHQANGGVLILRAEALVAQPLLWSFLKAALRDGEIRIEEFYRANSPPLAGAPKPVPIPLGLNVVMVGAPEWYYTFFAVDPEFQSYFKVKAEIEPTADATPANLACYAGLIQQAAASQNVSVDDGAMTRLLGLAARWAAHRERLTSSFELVSDVVIEAAKRQGDGQLDSEAIQHAVHMRRRRNGQIEDRVQRSIEDGVVIIRAEGAAVGQINGLTVQALGDHTFGAPARITARASVGRRGVINIERLVAMSGPIQQKGTMTLQGILMRRFAHEFPLSFDCSVTFEQMYGGVEGDSASMAEYLAIVSELAEVPIRQDLAITGSLNQLGEAQVIGGVHHKVEGFFRACESLGPLTGTQGVVIPHQNEANLIVRDEVRDAVESGQFHIWSVTSVEDAVGLFTGMEIGERDGDGGYPADSVYGRVMARLARFDAALKERA